MTAQSLSVATTPTTSETKFYTWKDFRCAYEIHPSEGSISDRPGLLLIHPIGVGLSRRFWDRFTTKWFNNGQTETIFNPDLLGCGESEMPHFAYHPTDYAEQLHYFLENVVKKPVVVISQGALLPVAIALVQKQSKLIKGLIFAGPPAWEIMTKPRNSLQQKLVWNLLDSPFGSLFYRYARRNQFLESFSQRNLFAEAEAVDESWLQTLQQGAVDPRSRYAVFSFLAGFWRKNYAEDIASITQPTLVVIGEEADSISNKDKPETPAERLISYVKHLPNAQGNIIPGRNVLPYESTTEFVEVVAEFCQTLD
ncbi:MAG: alpha/beta fold hydrolase [Oscillatoria sp. PMC 1051.18]|nr:alpha/beta fold hydrolase [Oscillatoria sp. PMC 1050.18]MEC5030962.1 alpha/beta fold hydrolase [Oscillatoria sp. PMC 1051.18]